MHKTLSFVGVCVFLSHTVCACAYLYQNECIRFFSFMLLLRLKLMLPLPLLLSVRIFTSIFRAMCSSVYLFRMRMSEFVGWFAFQSNSSHSLIYSRWTMRKYLHKQIANDKFSKGVFVTRFFFFGVFLLLEILWMLLSVWFLHAHFLRLIF